MSTALYTRRSTITVWVVEDNARYRQTLVHLLNEVSDLHCSAYFATCEEMQALIDGPTLWEPPDVVLMDIELKPEEDRGSRSMTGIEGITVLKKRLPEVPVVMLTINDSAQKIYEAFCAGASGYLIKTGSLDEIIEAVRETHRGGMLAPPSVARKVLAFFRQPTPQDYGLTSREFEVLRLMGEGYKKKEMAEALFLSPHTVDNYVRTIYQRLHVSSGIAAVAKAIRERLI